MASTYLELVALLDATVISECVTHSLTTRRVSRPGRVQTIISGKRLPRPFRPCRRVDKGAATTTASRRVVREALSTIAVMKNTHQTYPSKLKRICAKRQTVLSSNPEKAENVPRVTHCVYCNGGHRGQWSVAVRQRREGNGEMGNNGSSWRERAG